ncbi:C-type lectin lectoxin-Lio2-like [Vipera latastei]
MGRFISVSFGLLVVFLSLSGTGADQDCAFDWSSFNGSCYKFFELRKTWEDAEMYCRQEEEGGHLASIHSWNESAYMARLASNRAGLLPAISNVWIGLSDPEENRKWQWSDGSHFLYKSWKRGEPNHLWRNEYCVELSLFSGYFRWNGQRCGSMRYFICKFQPQVEGSNG